MQDLNGKVGVITGASSGIGSGVVRELGGAGMKLVITARRGDRLEALAAEVGGEVVRVPGDITDPELPGKLIATADQRFGRCDFVFNNAGVMQIGSITEIDLEAVCRMVRINVEAAYRLGLLALRYMVPQGTGDLINTSSILGMKMARPNVGAYAGTKYAIEAFTEDLRMQVAGTGVRVSALEPGLVETELQDHFPVHPKDALGIQQMAQPADLARAVRFVLEQPAHITIPRILVMPCEQAM